MAYECDECKQVRKTIKIRGNDNELTVAYWCSSCIGDKLEALTIERDLYRKAISEALDILVEINGNYDMGYLLEEVGLAMDILLATRKNVAAPKGGE